MRLERIGHRTDVTSTHGIVRIDEQEEGAFRGCYTPVPQLPSDVTSCLIHDLKSKSYFPVLDPTRTAAAAVDDENLEKGRGLLRSQCFERLDEIGVIDAWDDDADQGCGPFFPPLVAGTHHVIDR